MFIGFYSALHAMENRLSVHTGPTNPDFSAFVCSLFPSTVNATAAFKLRGRSYVKPCPFLSFLTMHSVLFIFRVQHYPVLRFQRLLKSLRHSYALL